jgi:hypothetical protein
MKIVLDSKGQLKARLQEGTKGILYVYDRIGHMVGFYDANTNRTFHANGHFFGMGDQRMSLVN